MTELTLGKLEEAFLLGCTDDEACLFANISPSALYDYQNGNKEFTERKALLKQTPVLEARSTVVKAIKTNPNLALQFLERKMKNEFAPRTELTGAEGTPLGYAYSSDIKQISTEEPKALPDVIDPST